MTNARLEELRSKFQENPRRYFAPYANELRKAGDPAQAISVCRTHLATQPGHVSGHIVLGQALYEDGDAQEARDVFTTALELDPENLIALRTLGEISQVKGDFVSARQWYERLLDADPRNSEVALLLKDLPTENVRSAAPAPQVQAHAAETTLEEHREQEHSPFAPPVAAPAFHSGFTGPGPAYRTADDLAEEQALMNAPPADGPLTSLHDSTVGEVELVEMDSVPMDDAPAEATSEASPGGMEQLPQSETIDMVDFSEFAPDSVAAESDHAEAEVAEPVAMAPPDESPDAPAAEAVDFAFAPSQSESLAEEQSHPSAEFEIPVEDATEEFEQPRALFAERGFDGPAGDQVGWVMTPPAVESDFESAPEDWFEPPVVESSPEVVAGEPIEEQQPVTASEPGHDTDSWFDDAAGASVVAATEGLTTEEFWLPPDLSQVPATPIAAAQEPALQQEPGQVAEAPSEGTEPVIEPSVTAQFQESAAPEAFEPIEGSLDAPAQASEVVEAGVSAIEYFDHSLPEPEVHEEDPAPEWTGSVDEPASDQPETYVQPVAEIRAEPVPSWEPPVEESSYAVSSEQVEADPRQEPTPAAEFESLAVAASVTDESRMSEPVVDQVAAVHQEAPTPSTPEPFVTETLAELYFQQGFRDEALAIYGQLVEREPSNVALRQRMEAIAQGQTMQPPAAELPAANRAASQSIRTFFSRLARRPAAASSPQDTVPESPSQPEVPFASAASALANLFAASKPPAADEGAAATLSGAYTNQAGRPSRAADRELSLDHLFRDVPGGSSSGEMSMDEFYSPPDASSGSPTDPGEGEPPESGGTDIRQFTAWLEGLRKK